MNVNEELEDEGKTKINPFNLNNKLISKEQVENIFRQEGVDKTISDLSIYQRAFVHKSYQKKKENSSSGDDIELVEKPKESLDLQENSNERLEYLGDAVINLIVAKYVYDRFPESDEGFLTRIRTKVVNGESLANLGRKIDLSEFLVISSHVEEKCNGRNNMRILEDAFESFFGAIFLDFNKLSLFDFNLKKNDYIKKFDELKNFKNELLKLTKNKNLISKIDSLFEKINEIENSYLQIGKENVEDLFSGPGFQVAEELMINIMEKHIYWPDLILKDTNYKDQLLRYFQQTYQSTPKYQEQSIDGPPHKRVFTMSVLDMNGNIVGSGTEKSKKKAEQLASKDALIKYCVINSDERC